MNKKIIIILLISLLPLGAVIAKENHDIAVFTPSEATGKLPTVFLAHNGGGKKEDWGDFPSQLADKGYLVLSIGWTDFAMKTDVKKAVIYCLETYGDTIDPQNVAFVGGCHGAAKLITLLGDSDISSLLHINAVAALSVSEEDPQMLASAERYPVPMLIIYAERDQYGYSEINASFAENVHGDPKKTIPIDTTPHGNELLQNETTKTRVSAAIQFWLKKYMR